MTSRDVSFHRRSIRLKGYDYSSPGAYFVTIVTRGHKCIFGKIIGSEMNLSQLGWVAHECWAGLPDHFPHVEVEPFVVMPNHIHAIVIIYENSCRGTIYRAPTTEAFGKPVSGSLPTMIRTFKAAVSRRANLELGWKNIWHRNYYEHILRNPSEMDTIASYILSNPGHWLADPENNP